jgi:ribonuclease VapC
MIVDSSAILAVVFREPGYEAILERLEATSTAAAGAPTLAETAIVLSARLRRDARGLFERLLQELRIQSVPFSEEHWRTAHDAYLRFGKGRHPARLNFGDCLSYATAKLADQPLLFVGSDFAKTDIAAAR